MKSILNRFSSIKLFFICMALLLAMCILGGVIPQNEPTEKYHQIFGHAFGALLVRLKFHDLFRSVAFIGVLALAGLNLFACSLKRWQSLRVRPGVLISHIAVLLIFTGGIVRGIYSQNGYLPLEVGGTSRLFYLTNGRAKVLPFAITLKDFQIHFWEEERHRIYAVRTADGFHEWADVRLGGSVLFNPIGITVETVKFYPHFALTSAGPVNLSEARENPALELMVGAGRDKRRKFVFANFPDFDHDQSKDPVRLIYQHIPGKIKQFESRLSISEGGKDILEKTIKVNSPMEFKGYRFYQSGYDPKNPRFSTLQVSKDPSVPFVYSGFMALLAGLAWAFWKHPGRL